MLSKAGVKVTLLALLQLRTHHCVAAPEDATSRAAELFEQGVRQFSSAQYQEAATAFFAADDLAPNPRALINGITAAQRAGLHLLAARAAERALARTDLDDAGASFAREALVEAGRHLSRVQVRCVAPSCALRIDGEVASSRDLYLLPGTHDFVGVTASGATASEHLSTVAGAAYRIQLEPREPEPPVSAPSVPDHADAKPLPRAFFYTGVAGTALLVGATIWSGLDTLSARSKASASSWGRVEDRALRTDLLLAGSVVLGAATTAAGLWLIDWRSSQITAMPLPGGGALMTQGRF